MSWNVTKEKKRMCELWLSNPLQNPETGLKIKRNGPTFMEWKTKCKELGFNNRPLSPGKGGQMSYDSCQEWNKNKLINPITGRKIIRGGRIYTKIEKACTNMKEKIHIIEGEYFIPNNKGLVPCKKDGNVFYILRRINTIPGLAGRSRYVYGPLNKYFRSCTTWVYFKDTWDYHLGHYKPIFINKKEPVKKIPLGRVQGFGGKETNDGIVDKIIDYFIRE